MIGIDLVKLDRIKGSLERFGDKFLHKYLCEDEIKIVKNYKTAAGFWAAKEACSKSIGTGIGKECSFHDIKIFKTPKGAPKISLSKKIIDRFNISDVSLSITHDGDYAIAVVAIEKNS